MYIHVDGGPDAIGVMSASLRRKISIIPGHPHPRYTGICYTRTCMLISVDVCVHTCTCICYRASSVYYSVLLVHAGFYPTQPLKNF